MSRFTDNGDPRTTDKVQASAPRLVVLALLTRLAHEQGRAVVIVTHDYRALTYADRIVYIEDGQIRLPDAWPFISMHEGV